MQPMRPIETIYNNYRFRSRLEARWAVFFDTLGIEYRYEPEGFELGDGIRYLPDFYLPEKDYWVEIKAGIPTPLEREKAARLCVATQKLVTIFVGDVWQDAHQIVHFFPLSEDLKEHLTHDRVQKTHQYYWLTSDECIDTAGASPIGVNLNLGYQWGYDAWGKCPNCHEIAWEQFGVTYHNFNGEVCNRTANPDENRLERAFLAARQARFEYNERSK